jgi:hypothetical protein
MTIRFTSRRRRTYPRTPSSAVRSNDDGSTGRITRRTSTGKRRVIGDADWYRVPAPPDEEAPEDETLEESEDDGASSTDEEEGGRKETRPR